MTPKKSSKSISFNFLNMNNFNKTLTEQMCKCVYKTDIITMKNFPQIYMNNVITRKSVIISYQMSTPINKRFSQTMVGKYLIEMNTSTSPGNQSIEGNFHLQSLSTC